MNKTSRKQDFYVLLDFISTNYVYIEIICKYKKLWLQKWLELQHSDKYLSQTFIVYSFSL